MADTLSRAHTDDAPENINGKEVPLVVHTIVDNLPISEIRVADTKLQQLKQL